MSYPLRHPRTLGLTPQNEHDQVAAARAAVLGRVWGALAREPLPGLAARHRRGDTLVVRFADGSAASGPAAAAEPFARCPTGLTIHTTGPHPTSPGTVDQRHTDPTTLLSALPLGPHTGRLAREVAD